MSRKRLDLVIQNVSMAMAVFVLVGFGLPKAVAYGTEIAAVEVMAAESQTSEAAPESTELSIPETPYESAELLTDFSVDLMQHTMEPGENTLISPYSVISALAMTANGADGNTLAQMENVFGLSIDQLNEYLHSYQEKLAEDKDNKLSAANSVWLLEDDSIPIKDDFLAVNEQWYSPEIYQTPMDDSTVKEINQWVDQKTDGMIPEIVDGIPDHALMYLVNALAFDAEWEKIYHAEEVRESEFTKEDGSKDPVTLMYSEENAYLQDEGAEGFLKYYKNRKYAFAALLPKKGTSVEEYIKGLTGERLHTVLANAQQCTVDAAIPQFKAEYKAELSGVLSETGMPDAFSDSTADFTKMCSCDPGEVHMERVLHRTFMEVDEAGTRAGAVTAVEMVAESAMEEPEMTKVVHLDRPFIYMLIDTEELLPIFIGTAMNMEG